MAEGTYVKLNEDHHSGENITPGELNQAIDVDKLHARICEQCGQVLPPSYIPPADEDWATGIFGFCEDADSCLTGFFCPCVQFGRNVAALNDDISSERACIGHAVCIEGGIAAAAVTAAFHGVIDPDSVCLLTEGLLFAWWVCAIYTGMGRQLLQRRYHLKDSPCDPCLVHCCLHWCAICQEHREMQHHLSDFSTSDDTVVRPPEAQEMNAAAQKHENVPSSDQGDDAPNNLQLQPV
ncbi:UNVERIFIED_CONTAM: Cell number regulator 6 [Sesamum calycinum]|uniref:Cell number regulator 6 n=2 Tax=Sesamum TaxID=4181 RepID=A0AAE1WQ07_9LAMI|nr:Cell number regulator 6 [Sesamum angolense]